MMGRLPLLDDPSEDEESHEERKKAGRIMRRMSLSNVGGFTQGGFTQEGSILDALEMQKGLGSVTRSISTRWGRALGRFGSSSGLNGSQGQLDLMSQIHPGLLAGLRTDSKLGLDRVGSDLELSGPQLRRRSTTRLSIESTGSAHHHRHAGQGRLSVQSNGSMPDGALALTMLSEDTTAPAANGSDGGATAPFTEETLRKHMRSSDAGSRNSISGAGDDDCEDTFSDEDERAMQIAVRRGKRVSISSSAAESYIEELNLPGHAVGSLSHTVFGPQQRIARIDEEELGEYLLALEGAAAVREPLSPIVRGYLLSGFALADQGTMSSLAKLGAGKVVRFFFSSTFADTALERDLFLEDCVPFLRRVMEMQGLEFQVSEMRWGINNLLSETHRTSSECLKELNRCLESSVGLAFVGLLGDRYGYRPFPAIIDAALFKQLLTIIDRMPDARGGSGLLCKWFVEDNNTIPPVFRLLPIHVHLPAYIDMSKEGEDARRQAEGEWWGRCFEPMQSDLRRAALALRDENKMSPEDADVFVRSVTSEEMSIGIPGAAGKDDAWGKARSKPEPRVISEDAESDEYGSDYSEEDYEGGRSVLILRNLVGVREASNNDPAKTKYLDWDPSTEKEDAEAAQLMFNLREKLSERVPTERLFSFDVEWRDGGIDPVKYEEHRQYLADFSDTLCRLNIEEIVTQLQSRPIITDLENEFFHHLLLCQRKAQEFSCREPLLAKVEQFFTSETGPNTMVIVGEVGLGKSLVLAEAARRLATRNWEHTKAKSPNKNTRQAVKWKRGTLDGDWNCTGINQDLARAASVPFKKMLEVELVTDRNELHSGPMILLRFVGTSRLSMSARDLMHTFMQQVVSYYSSLPEDVPVEYLALKDALPQCLSRATASKPLFIILDGLDQISEQDAGHDLEWLPMGESLPAHVKLLVSTLPDAETYKVLNDRLGQKGEYVTLKAFGQGEREEMLNSWLNKDKRQLVPEQRGSLLNASGKDPSVLLLRMLYERSLSWMSTTPVQDIGRLPESAEEAISLLLSELEQMHTPQLVHLLLGSITASREGMSAGEMEDLASSSNEVLVALFVWWAPPMARVPPLQVVRLLHDIKSYTSEKVGSGMHLVFQWAHRQFHKQCMKRYLPDQGSKEAMHSALADLFSGAKSKRDLPLTVHLKNGEVKHLPGDRRLPAQEPVLVRVAGNPALYNERMLKELPLHLMGSRRFAELVDLLSDADVFEYMSQDTHTPELASYWRAILESSPESNPRDAYMRMLDNLDPETKELKQARLARGVGIFVGEILARLVDAEVFMSRAVNSCRDKVGQELELAKGLDGKGKVLLVQGKYADALEVLASSLELKKQILGDKSVEVAATMHIIADVQQKKGRYREALALYETSCSIRRELQGEDTRDVAASLGCMGVVHKKLGNYDDALAHYEQSKTILEIRLGKENLTVATALMNIANVFTYQGKYKEALEKHEESLDIKTRILGWEHPEVAKSLGNMAGVLEKLGRLDAALEKNYQTLEIQIQKLGPRSQDVARTRKGIGLILGQQGKLDEALDQLNQALSITLKRVGPRHSDSAALRSVVADVQHKKGDLQAALNNHTEALSITRYNIGEGRKHIAVARGLRGIASVLMTMGRVAEALERYREALDQTIASVGPEHRNVAVLQDLVGVALGRLGRYEEALEMHSAAGATRKGKAGSSMEVASSCAYTGDAYTKLGKYKEALESYTNALHIQEKYSKGKPHPDIAGTLDSMGVVYKKCAQYKQALDHYHRARDMLRDLYGEDNMAFATVTMNLANVKQHLGLYEESLELHEQALATKIKHLGNDHQEVAKSLGNMGSVYDRVGKLDKAVEVYKRCLKIQKSVLDGRSLDVARTMRGMGGVLKAQGKFDEALAAYNESSDITLERVGRRHLDSAEILYSIGVVLQVKGTLKDAQQKFTESLEIVKALVGEDHKVAASALRGLGSVLAAEDKNEAALDAFSRSVDITLRLVGRENLDSAITRHSMSMLLFKMGKVDEAQVHLATALKVFVKVLGSDHEWTQNASKGLGFPLGG